MYCAIHTPEYLLRECTEPLVLCSFSHLQTSPDKSFCQDEFGEGLSDAVPYCHPLELGKVNLSPYKIRLTGQKEVEITERVIYFLNDILLNFYLDNSRSAY